MQATIKVQNADAVKTDLPVSPASTDHTGTAMVSETIANINTVWVANTATEDTGAFVYMYEVDNTGKTVLKSTITLPIINDKNSTWDPSQHRTMTATYISYLRIYGDYIWAADFSNGAIYRFSKTFSTAQVNADIIFFKPTLISETPYQFYDVAFQSKSSSSLSSDRLWVADGVEESDNIYSIDVPNGFNYVLKTGERPLTTITPYAIDGKILSTEKEFCEIFCHNKQLWVMVRNNPEPDKNGLLTVNVSGMTPTNPHFIKVDKAGSIIISGDNLIIGKQDGGLLKKDIKSADDVEVQLPPTQFRPAGLAADPLNPAFDHYRMSIDAAGYIWSTAGLIYGGSSKVNCYTPQGHLARQYDVLLPTATSDANNWTSPVIVGNAQIAVVDALSNTLGVFTVDDGFIMGDFNLKFDPTSETKSVDEVVSTLPLEALNSANTANYGNAASAILSGKDVQLNLEAAQDFAVEIVANAKSVTLTKAVNTGTVAGSATVTAEARTTGTNRVTYTLTVSDVKPVIKPLTNDVDHGGVDGNTIDIRQGKPNELKGATITANPGKEGTVTIDDTSKSTGTKFTGPQTKPNDDLNTTVPSITGKTVPDITGGHKIGDASIKVTVGTDTSPSKTLNVVAMADKVTASKNKTSVSLPSIIPNLNKNLVITTSGKSDLNVTTSSEIFAPKTLVKLEIITKNTSLKFLKNSVSQGTTVYMLTDKVGKLAFNKTGLQLEGTLTNADLKTSDSYISISFDDSGSMSDSAPDPTTRKYISPTQVNFTLRSF